MIKYIIAIAVLWFLYRISTKKGEKIVVKKDTKIDFKKIENNYLLKLFKNVTFRSSYILIIRSFPILPHILGSYIIASSKIKKKEIDTTGI